MEDIVEEYWKDKLNFLDKFYLYQFNDTDVLNIVCKGVDKESGFQYAVVVTDNYSSVGGIYGFAEKYIVEEIEGDLETVKQKYPQYFI